MSQRRRRALARCLAVAALSVRFAAPASSPDSDSPQTYKNPDSPPLPPPNLVPPLIVRTELPVEGLDPEAQAAADAPG